jgi:hypothetical protein
VSDHPSCAARTRDGERCRSATVSGSPFCQHHHGLVARGEVSEEALRRGDHVQRRRRSRDTRLAQVASERVEPEQADPNGSQPPPAVTTANGNVSPAQVRSRLGELAAENLSELERVLLETATGADKPVWVTTTCKGCGRDGRHEVTIPDYRVRLDAVEKLLQQGLGRAREAEERPAARMPESAEKVASMNWEELQSLAAVVWLEGFQDLARTGSAEALLHERIAALSDGERRVLRRAVALPPPA